MEFNLCISHRTGFKRAVNVTVIKRNSEVRHKVRSLFVFFLVGFANIYLFNLFIYLFCIFSKNKNVQFSDFCNPEMYGNGVLSFDNTDMTNYMLPVTFCS